MTVYSYSIRHEVKPDAGLRVIGTRCYRTLVKLVAGAAARGVHENKLAASLRRQPFALRFYFSLLLMLVILSCSSSPLEHTMPPPKRILPDLAWSFSEPTPASVEEFVAAVEAYARDIHSRPNKNELLRVFPGARLDIEYTYWVRETESGPWTEKRKVVRVHANGKSLTYAAVIWRLHQAAYGNLANQDHRFFEGLYLLDHEFEPGVPAYEVHLGS